MQRTANAVEVAGVSTFLSTLPTNSPLTSSTAGGTVCVSGYTWCVSFIDSINMDGSDGRPLFSARTRTTSTGVFTSARVQFPSPLLIPSLFNQPMRPQLNFQAPGYIAHCLYLFIFVLSLGRNATILCEFYRVLQNGQVVFAR